MHRNHDGWTRTGWVICAIAAGAAAGCGRPAPAETGRVPEPAIRVRTTVVTNSLFRETVTVQGTIEARNRAQIAARTAGTIEDMRVDMGDRVRKDQLLFQIDSTALRQECEVAQHGLDVAVAGRTEAEAARAEMRAVQDKARKDLERMTRLFREDHAISQDQFEQAQTGASRAEAALARAEAGVALAQARLAQAESAARIAEKKLADARGCAPFDGVVVLRSREQGDYAAAGNPVLTLESTEAPDLVFVLDAPLYARIAPHQTRIRFRLAGGQTGDAVVRQIAPSVNPGPRTFIVKAALPGLGRVPLGMIADVTIDLGGHTAPGIPEEALLRPAGLPAVFVVEQGKARARTVQPGLQNEGQIELIDAQALIGTRVVTEGQTLLRDGIPVEETGIAR